MSNQPARFIDPRLGPVDVAYPVPGSPRILLGAGIFVGLGGVALSAAAVGVLIGKHRLTGDDYALGALAFGTFLIFVGGEAPLSPRAQASPSPCRTRRQSIARTRSGRRPKRS